MGARLGPLGAPLGREAVAVVPAVGLLAGRGPDEVVEDAEVDGREVAETDGVAVGPDRGAGEF